MPSFRFRRLERYKIGGTRDRMELSIPLPTTPTGKSYRWCPIDACEPRLFLLGEAPADQVIPDDHVHLTRRAPGTPGTTCPYCGNDSPDDRMIHPHDIEAAKKYITWAATQDAGDYIEGVAKDFNRSMRGSSGGLIQIEMDVKRPRLNRPSVWREDLLRNLACDICSREYGVYTIALYCPDCGAPNVHVHFRREVELISRQIELANNAEADGNKELAYRLLGNAHEDVLTAFETYLKTIFRFLVKKHLPTEEADRLITKKAIGNHFQNIRRGRKLYLEIGIDPYEGLEADDLTFLQLNIEKRHVVGHNLSMVDQTYSETSQGKQPGETVSLLGEEVRRFASICYLVVARLETHLTGI